MSKRLLRVSIVALVLSISSTFAYDVSQMTMSSADPPIDLEELSHLTYDEAMDLISSRSRQFSGLSAIKHMILEWGFLQYLAFRLPMFLAVFVSVMVGCLVFREWESRASV